MFGMVPVVDGILDFLPLQAEATELLCAIPIAAHEITIMGSAIKKKSMAQNAINHCLAPVYSIKVCDISSASTSACLMILDNFGDRDLRRVHLKGCNWYVLRTICTRFTNLTHIHMVDNDEAPHFDDLSPLQYCTNLEELTLTGCANVTDISAICSLTRLAHLHLGLPHTPKSTFSNTATFRREFRTISDLTAIASCKNLTCLDLTWAAEITTIAPLEFCNSLRLLNLSWCIKLHDIKSISACHALQELHLCQCFMLTDIDPLSFCTSLTSLDLTRCHKVTDLRPLVRCKKLNRLVLTWCQMIADVSPLSSCTNLKIVDLSHTAVDNVSSLAACSNLESVTTRGTPLELEYLP